jgi:hypothetical protein
MVRSCKVKDQSSIKREEIETFPRVSLSALKIPENLETIHALPSPRYQLDFDIQSVNQMSQNCCRFPREKKTFHSLEKPQRISISSRFFIPHQTKSRTGEAKSFLVLLLNSSPLRPPAGGDSFGIQMSQSSGEIPSSP